MRSIAATNGEKPDLILVQGRIITISKIEPT